MNIKLISLFLIYLTFFLSCQDRKNIIVTGQITDKATRKPIPNAEVVVHCWYMNDIYDATYNSKTIMANKNGNYKVTFEIGHQVNVASKAIGYQPSRSYNELSNNIIKVDLTLTKAEKNPTLITVLNTDNLAFDMTDRVPFLRVRTYTDEQGNELNSRTTQTFGFDFKTLKSTTDTLSADLWFKIEKTEGQPKTILTGNKGGVIPITRKEVKESLLYEKEIAPTSGYKSIYKLQGNEEGFFVLCRDGKTYGKIILEKTDIDKSGPDGKGNYYKEFGKNFSCFYQTNGTTNLKYSQTDISLGSFLVDYRY